MIITLKSSIGSQLRVDAEAGIIYGVPVITAGTTKTSGNGVAPFDVDAVTLQQVTDAINESTGGVPSRMTHPEVEGTDSINHLVGTAINARIEGNRVLADMKLGAFAEHSPQGNMRAYLLGIAQDVPSAAGLSITANQVSFEPSDTATGRVLRIGKLNTVDFVGDPAANPTGMLSATTPSKEIAMNEMQIKYLQSLGLAPDATTEAITAFYDALSPEEKTEVDAMAQPDLSQTPTEPVKPVDASTPAPVAAPAKVAASAKPVADNGTLAERQRYRDLNDIALSAKLGNEWVAEQYLKGTTADEARRVALSSLASTREPLPMATPAVNVGEDLNRVSLHAAVSDAILLRAGGKFIKFDTDGRVALGANGAEQRNPHERAQQFRGHSVIEMGRRYLLALGYRQADNLDRASLARLLMSRSNLMAALPGVFLAHSTGDFPYILADVIGKSLRTTYALQRPTWRAWCRATTAPDFKTISKVQLSQAADLAAMKAGDEYTYGTLTESRETYSLGKFGKAISYTREMIINDDLDAFSRVPQQMANACTRLEQTTAYGILTANAALADTGALFNATAVTTAGGHANQTSGAPTVALLGTARALMRKQVALGSSDPLDITPAFFLVPEALAVTAEQLISSTVDPSKSNATPNPFSNRLTVISEPRLDANSATAWYLAADPSSIDTIEMAFLEGEEAPTVEEQDEFDNDTRKVKVRHYLAAKAIDFRGLVKSTG
jgi:hypothetical protein